MTAHQAIAHSSVHHDLKVADEVFLLMAMLHRQHPDREDFEVKEVLDLAHALKLAGEVRPGVATHLSRHCVANKSPQPGAYRMLYATEHGRRRLLRPGDDVHPERTGKMFPYLHEVPQQYGELVRWAMERYEAADTAPTGLAGLAQLRGSGKGLWPEGADAFVREVRKGWA